MESEKLVQKKVNLNKESLVQEVSDSYKVKGPKIFSRTHQFYDGLEFQKKYQLWLHYKTAIQSPSATSKGHDAYGNFFEGPNFATQDYLGLSQNESTKEASMKVIQEFGIHSGGAALAFGTHPWYLDFQKEIGDYLGVNGVVLFSAGWMGNYGVIKALIRESDHIVMDKMAENSLHEGARASTRNIHLTEHLDDKGMIEKIKALRQKYPERGILLVAESLYSLDSTAHDLVYLQQECLKYNAFLLIDTSNDLGAIGKEGKGLEVQKLTDLSNVLLSGSGSKVLGTNIGFVGCKDIKVLEYMRYFSPPYMFSNVVAPPQCAGALHNLRIVRSPKGEELRKKVMDNAIYLRKKLNEKGFDCLGSPSPLVVVMLGDELINRLVSRLMLDKGVIVNGVEFPAVPKGKARLRLQLQAIHTKEHLDLFVEKLEECLEEAKDIASDLNKKMSRFEIRPKL
jgi:glycine C-acetyltransferase